MKTAGLICEFNPLHSGHLHLLRCWRSAAGEESRLLCVMSGNFVQRGEFALLDKFARAEAAVRCGADLVLELPTPYAVATAQRFADSAVSLLLGTGVVDTLLFGSECGDAGQLQALATALEEVERNHTLQFYLETGMSFAAARQKAVEAFPAVEGRLLEQSNNILGVEYLKALRRRHSSLSVMTVPRLGAGHDEMVLGEETASGAALRALLQRGETADAYLPAPMREIYAREQAAGRAPLEESLCQRAILARLRAMEEEDFAPYDGGREGLYHRFYQAVRQAASVEALLQQVKTRRYPYARLRRMMLQAYLGLKDFPENPPYLRLLACNRQGRELLREMKDKASLPVLTKAADVRQLSRQAQELFALEVRCTDLYTLAFPALSQATGGREWRCGPVIVE